MTRIHFTLKWKLLLINFKLKKPVTESFVETIFYNLNER